MIVAAALLLIGFSDTGIDRIRTLAPQLDVEEAQAVSPYLRCLYYGEGRVGDQNAQFDVTTATGQEIADRVQAGCDHVRKAVFAHASAIMRRKGIGPVTRKTKIEAALKAFDQANYLIASAPEAHGKANAPH